MPDPSEPPWRINLTAQNYLTEATPLPKSSGNLWLLPSELKEGSHFWLLKRKEGSSHETLCRTGPVDGQHAGLHRR